MKRTTLLILEAFRTPSFRTAVGCLRESLYTGTKNIREMRQILTKAEAELTHEAVTNDLNLLKAARVCNDLSVMYGSMEKFNEYWFLEESLRKMGWANKDLGVAVKNYLADRAVREAAANLERVYRRLGIPARVIRKESNAISELKMPGEWLFDKILG